MRKSLLASLLFFLTISSAQADTTDLVTFGKKLLDSRYQVFADKMVECDQLAENNLLSEDTIKQLRSIHKDDAVALIVASHKALQTCATYEYNEVLRTLVLLQERAATEKKDLSEYFNLMHSLLVADMSLFTEKNYSNVSKSVKEKINNIEELKSPFNVQDAVFRTWSY